MRIAGERENGGTNRDTLESNARSSAASPYTFSPLFSLSISIPPSYLPISRVAGAVASLSFVAVSEVDF